jgi:hypothetical protein
MRSGVSGSMLVVGSRGIDVWSLTSAAAFLGELEIDLLVGCISSLDPTSFRVLRVLVDACHVAARCAAPSFPEGHHGFVIDAGV